MRGLITKLRTALKGNEQPDFDDREAAASARRARQRLVDYQAGRITFDEYRAQIREERRQLARPG